MLFLIQSVDKPDSAELRAATRPDHLRYLDGFADRILVGGPTLSDDGATATGSVLIVDLEDRAAAERFCADDPYAKAGLFATTTIQRWRQVLPAP